jgi:hypothetical protein
MMASENRIWICYILRLVLQREVTHVRAPALTAPPYNPYITTDKGFSISLLPLSPTRADNPEFGTDAAESCDAIMPARVHSVSTNAAWQLQKKESALHVRKSWIGLKNVQMAAYGHHFRAGYRQVSWHFAFS